MKKTTSFQYVQREDLDVAQWDNCVSASPAGRIYAQSFYLDNMCPGWSGLVGENYAWVMPVTARRKWGIRYLYQPAFLQQLGAFAGAGVVIPFEAVNSFLQHKFSFWEVSWNEQTALHLASKNIEKTAANNYVLSLDQPYKIIAEAYHPDLKRNLKHSYRFTLKYQKTNDFKKCVKLFTLLYAPRLPQVKDRDFEHLGLLCTKAESNGMLLCREVIDQEETLATAVLLFDGKRLYNLMNSTTETGRKTKANHYLFNAIIHEFAGQKLLLDFEGSDLPGVKEFYDNFGGVNEPFVRIKYNQLPWPLRLLK